MKSIHLIAIALLSLAPVHAHETGKGGPNGGRLLASVSPHAEFLVTPERKVRITFLGENGKPIAHDTAEISVTTGDRSAPVTMKFVKEGTSFLSEKPLPDGENLPVVVRVKTDAEAKPVTDKFTLNLSICGECKHPEYACTCGH